jgi:hypothetical protein
MNIKRFKVSFYENILMSIFAKGFKGLYSQRDEKLITSAIKEKGSNWVLLNWKSRNFRIEKKRPWANYSLQQKILLIW